MRARTLITGGGTGGHVYPALSIIRYLRTHQRGERVDSARGAQATPLPDGEDLVYIGNSRGLERTLVPRAGIRSFFLPMAPPASPRGLALLTIATLRSLAILLRIRPRATLATGGYVSVPATVASWALRVPTVLFLPDVVPGKAVAWLIPLVQRVAVSTEDALRYLPSHKTVVTGYPVRESFAGAARAEARARFNIPTDATAICVFGGSQGARSINVALARCLPALLKRYHVLHICGEQRFDEAREAANGLPADDRARYHLFPYLHDREMADALVAADLVVSRSGASVLGELPAAGVPGVLVPLPEPRVHQRENAAYLADRGAAVVVENDDLQDRLENVLDELLSDRAGLSAMASASRALFRPDAAEKIGTLVAEVAR